MIKSIVAIVAIMLICGCGTLSDNSIVRDVQPITTNTVVIPNTNGIPAIGIKIDIDNLVQLLPDLPENELDIGWDDIGTVGSGWIILNAEIK